MCSTHLADEVACDVCLKLYPEENFNTLNSLSQIVNNIADTGHEGIEMVSVLLEMTTILCR